MLCRLVDDHVDIFLSWLVKVCLSDMENLHQLAPDVVPSYTTKWFFQLQSFTFSQITNIFHHVELPPQPLKGCYQFCCLVNRGTMGVNSLPKTDTRHRRDCDLNPGPSAPESSTLTTRLPSQLKAGWITKYTKKAHTIKRTKMICRYGDFTVFEMAAVR